MTAGLAWEAAFQPHPAVSPGSLIDALRPSVGYLPEVGQQAIGVFGSLDARMPTAGYLLWLALVGVLAAAALAVGGRPSRIKIVALLGGMVVVTVILSLPVREYSPLQGRYILPLLVLAPLWLGDVVLHRRERLPEAVVTGLVVGTFATAAAVQLLAWWTSARRFAVGSDQSWLFLGSADWSPPLGWWTWLLVAALAAAASVAAGTLPLLWRRLQGSAGPP
jgi:hypothetical protein